MESDERFTALLERAAGPDPGSGNETDVRRRARRHVRRRRAAVGAAAAALVLPGLFVAGRFQPDDKPDVVSSELGAATQPGGLLFERPLPDGSTLRVTTGAVPDEIAVAWPGSPEPVILTLGAGGDSGTTTVDEWSVLALRPCPGDEAAHIRAFQTADPALSDEMGLIDGLAVVIVPPLVSPSSASLPDTTAVAVEIRDADGSLLSSVTINGDVVASEEDRPDEPTDSTSPSQPPDRVEEATDGLPRCEDSP
jgi:hypothetical protein